ncbi:MAG: hypothetical protein ABIC95_00780 [archaeon]
MSTHTAKGKGEGSENKSKKETAKEKKESGSGVRNLGGRDLIVLTLLFMASFYIYSNPARTSDLPFGEGDAAHQIGRANYMAVYDSASRELPFYIASWYSWENPDDFFAPINAAPFMVNAAIMQVIGGQKIVPIQIFYAIIANFTIVLAVFFVIRKLYGFYPATLAGFFLLFPLRNTIGYIWGQRTVLLALAYIPLIVYCYYRYTQSVLNGKEKKTYMFLAAAFLGIAPFFHPATGLLGISVLGSYTALLLILKRKLPFRISTAIIGVVIFAALFLPFYSDYAGQGQSALGSFKIQHLGTLFTWYTHPSPQDNPIMYDFSKVHGGMWTIPFILAATLLLIVRRQPRDIALLAWLIGLYLMLHADVLGFHVHADRILKGSSHIFYPLVAIAFFMLPSFIPVKKDIKGWIRIGAMVVLALLIFTLNKPPVIKYLEDPYPVHTRISQAQLELADWMAANLPEHAIVYSMGQLTYPKERFTHVLSERAFMPGRYLSYEAAEEMVAKYPITDHTTHLLFDYSDWVMVGEQGKPYIAQLQQAEAALTGDHTTLVYDQNYIKVYAVG